MLFYTFYTVGSAAIDQVKHLGRNLSSVCAAAFFSFTHHFVAQMILVLFYLWLLLEHIGFPFFFCVRNLLSH